MKLLADSSKLHRTKYDPMMFPSCQMFMSFQQEHLCVRTRQARNMALVTAKLGEAGGSHHTKTIFKTGRCSQRKPPTTTAEHCHPITPCPNVGAGGGERTGLSHSLNTTKQQSPLSTNPAGNGRIVAASLRKITPYKWVDYE